MKWNFPGEKVFLKVEMFFIGLLAVFIFVMSLLQHPDKMALPFLFTILFLTIYVLVGYGTKRYMKMNESYKITKTHFHATRKHKYKTVKEKVALKDIRRHKLDKFFYGGYFVTKKNRKHLVFFNNRNEVEQFEKFLTKHSKSTC